MTNEKYVEEILFEAYKLGVASELFDLVKNLSNEYKDNVTEMYETALNMVKNNKN
jgi:hypothetical protein